MTSRTDIPILLLAGLGAIDAWAGWSSYLSPDSASYLDMATDIAAGHVTAAINGYWSPLYPVILSVFLRFAGSDARTEFAIVRIVDFLIYLAAIAAFHAFLKRVLDRAMGLEQDGSTSSMPFTRAQLELVGWSAFAWGCLSLHTVSRIGPDGCVIAVVFASLAALLSLGDGKTSVTRIAAFGAILGIGYWAKTVMLPVGLVFLLAALFEPAVWRVRKRLLISAAALVLLAAPLAAALSIKYGRPTLGDSGSLNYAWFVNGVANFVNWQGGPAGSGSPAHASRIIFRNPDAFEFGAPITSTYAPWYEPSYWYEGVQVHWDSKSQILLIVRNAGRLVRILSEWAFLIPAAIFTISLCIWRRFGALARTLRGFAPIWIVCFSGVAAYVAVHVEPRYFTPFLVPVPLLLMAGVRRPIDHRGQGAFGNAVAGLCVLGACLTCGPRLVAAGETVIRSRGSVHDANWEAAEALAATGITSGTSVAFIGRTLGVGWARLARVRIVAQVPKYETSEHPDENMIFWKSPRHVREAVLQTFARTGASFVIANDVPEWADTSEWHAIPQSGFFYRILLREGGE